MVINIGENNSLFNQYIAEIRDQEVQQDSMRFRRNLERVGEIFAYEISKKMEFYSTEVTTPLGIAEVPVLSAQPVIASIMRAGLPIHQGFLNSFDKAENIFITAYRKYEKDGTFQINFEHISGPTVDEKEVILVDPMLATGASMVLAYNALLRKGTPRHTHIVSVIASKEGIEYMQKHLVGKKYTLWTGAIDSELTVKSYIVPGLGDAGDLAYGAKE
ncbi:MAG: uracil phosphoribosyltransferase [Bacteroidetes bacterium HGW-Bacteroidetes-4]|jgi:uracil phosphoribosyltransferase|nr:MAG: uracil phosphoribosyltransferase [Bacteroidetes bacterium HGW-Bacteroidetes-4]